MTDRLACQSSPITKLFNFMSSIMHQRMPMISRWWLVALLMLLALQAPGGYCVEAALNVPDYEISALHDLYNATKGDSWTWSGYGNHWNFTEPNPCADTWMGVTCSAVATAGFLNVITLELLDNGLSGTIPPSLGNLTKLEVLELFDNHLTGSIPDSVGRYTQLSILALYGNALNGSLPNALGLCTRLTQLNVHDNQLSGTIPSSLGFCTQLSLLYAYFNALTGSIPDTLGQCSSLSQLWLDDNALTGSIPETLGQCTQLTTLFLYNNQLNGSIPSSLGQCTQLEKLEAFNNQLSGQIPDALGQCTQLTELDLGTNRLTGHIPPGLAQCTRLAVLDLGSNQLSGSIPPELGQCTRLTQINFNTNHLTGSIPDTLGQCTKLAVLQLDHNVLTGNITSELGQCTLLTDLYVNDNRLTGSIPDTLGSCTLLTDLYMNNNFLTGVIPASLGQCAQLNVLQLDHNRLNGNVSKFSGQCPLLEVVALSDNHITGAFPGFMLSTAYPKLKALKCDENMLTGTLPEVQGGQLKLELLNASYNQLSGAIPGSLVAALSKLYVLYANNNQLTGILPQNWTAPAGNLRLVHLQSNHLCGSIPLSMGYLPMLQHLNLSGNSLTGTIPASFQMLAALQSLQLKDNQLQGSIGQLFDPSGTQLNLSVVQLSGNQLTGALPAAAFQLPSMSSFAAVDNCLEGSLPEEAICSSSSLISLVLDGLHSASACSSQLSSLSGKGFVLGTLPQCLLEMPALTTLHLSGSGLTGSFPAEARISAALTDLSLSHKLLMGNIPESVLGRDWVKLDLSYNRLTGTLSGANAAPYSNGTQLYLQQNRLSGVIPRSLRQVGSLSVLRSNMFSCRADRSDVPTQDSDSEKYKCGSDAVNNALYGWLGVVLVTIATVGAALGLGLVAANSLPLSSLPRQELLAGYSRVISVGTAVSWLGAASAAYCIVVLLPVYSAEHASDPTFTYLYAWVVSGVFQSGITAFLLDAVFLGLLLMTSNWLANRLGLVTPVGNLGQVYSVSLGNCASQWDVRNVVLPAFSLAVVVGINVGFVIATLRLNGRVLTIIQILLAVFKLGFNHVVAPALQRRTAKHFAKAESSVVPPVSALQLLLSVLNVVVIPCLVVAFISPTCFYDALKGSDDVTSSYEYPGTCGAFVEYFTTSGFLVSFNCQTRQVAVDQTSYTPPFAYSYQCGSSFVTYYAPTFVIMCIISAFLVPALRWLLLWLRRHLSPRTRFHQLVTAITPRILKELQSPEELVKSRTNPLKRPVFNANQLIISVLTYLALLLTFGALFPPLAVCCAVAMTSVVLMARLEVGRYVAAAVAVGRQDCVDEVERVCAGAIPPQQLSLALNMVLSISCLFYTLFLFDTLGDEVGFSKAFWVLIVVPLLALAQRPAYVLLQLLFLSPTRATVTAAHDAELGVDLPEVASSEGSLADGVVSPTAKSSTVAGNPMHAI